MTRACHCAEPHPRRRIVLTGGPGAGKTAVLEMLRASLCRHVSVLPESAAMIFNDGFPRDPIPGVRRAAQRAIYHVQVELESAMDARGASIMLCDRGVVDGAAYWPGPDDYWTAVGTTRAAALRRYDAVIHLSVPSATNGYGNTSIRIETAAEASLIDERILAAWADHPRRYVVPPSFDFVAKAQAALAHVFRELPPCCRPDPTVSR